MQLVGRMLGDVLNGATVELAGGGELPYRLQALVGMKVRAQPQYVQGEQFPVLRIVDAVGACVAERAENRRYAP